MKLLFLFLSLFYFSICSSQKNRLSDDEYFKLQEKARALINSNIDSSFILSNKIEESNYYIHKSFAKGIKSYLFQLKGDSIRSKESYKQAIDFLKQTPNSIEKTRTEAYLLNYLGLSEWKRNNFNLAIQKYNEAKEKAIKLKDKLFIVKINNNLGLVYVSTDNYNDALKIFLENDLLTNKIYYLYDEKQFVLQKSNIYLRIGSGYEKKYRFNISKFELLDSAKIYFEKALLFSKDLVDNRIIAKINIGIIYSHMRKFHEAEKYLIDANRDSRSNKNETGYFSSSFNLGEIEYNLKKYDDALLYFQKVDSLSKGIKFCKEELIYSNYYQAKIYHQKGNFERAVYYSNIYFEKLKQFGSKFNEEVQLVNLGLHKADINKEIILIKENNDRLFLMSRIKIYIFIFFIIFCSLVFYFFQKKKNEKKISLIIEEYRFKTDSNEMLKEDSEEGKDFKINFSLDEIRENEILEKLKKLVENEYYLSKDFNIQNVAKKIKTNTTYLSHVVNKKIGKSFSEYSNELKINYIINKLNNDSTYRKYSTQALAESVGFKNAISFSKSFKKRTGVSPVLFVKKITD